MPRNPIFFVPMVSAMWFTCVRDFVQFPLWPVSCISVNATRAVSYYLLITIAPELLFPAKYLKMGTVRPAGLYYVTVSGLHALRPGLLLL
jgi:hypothetical protein